MQVETAVLSVTHKKKPSILDRSTAIAVKEVEVREKPEKDKEEEMEIDSTTAGAVLADSVSAVPTTVDVNSEHKLAESRRYLNDIQVQCAFD